MVSSSLGQVSFFTEHISVETTLDKIKDSIAQTIIIRNTSDEYVYILLDSKDVLTAAANHYYIDTNYYQTHIGLIKAINFNHYPNQVMDLSVISPNESVVITSKILVSDSESKKNTHIWNFHIDYLVSKSKDKKYTNYSYRQDMVKFSAYGIRLCQLEPGLYSQE